MHEHDSPPWNSSGLRCQVHHIQKLLIDWLNSTFLKSQIRESPKLFVGNIGQIVRVLSWILWQDLEPWSYPWKLNFLKVLKELFQAGASVLDGDGTASHDVQAGFDVWRVCAFVVIGWCRWCKKKGCMSCCTMFDIVWSIHAIFRSWFQIYFLFSTWSLVKWSNLSTAVFFKWVGSTTNYTCSSYMLISIPNSYVLRAYHRHFIIFIIPMYPLQVGMIRAQVLRSMAATEHWLIPSEEVASKSSSFWWIRDVVVLFFLGGGFKYFFFSPPTWGRFPFWLIFFRWVETTNQFWMVATRCKYNQYNTPGQESARFNVESHFPDFSGPQRICIMQALLWLYY